MSLTVAECGPTVDDVSAAAPSSDNGCGVWIGAAVTLGSRHSWFRAASRPIPRSRMDPSRVTVVEATQSVIITLPLTGVP